MINEEFLRSLNIDEDAILKIISTLNEDMEKKQFDEILKSEISLLNPHDIELVLKLLDIDGLELKDGKIEGLSERLEEFVKKYPFLFENTEAPKIVSSTKAQEKLTQEDFDKMGYKEKSLLYQKNPNLYKKLANA